MLTWAQVAANFDKTLNVDEITEFLAHLESSTNSRLKKLTDEKTNLSEDQFEDPGDMGPYADALSEEAAATRAVRDLGSQLAIVALYKKVERHTSRVVQTKIPSAASKKLGYFKTFREALPFEIKTVQGYQSFNELRLLNNSIKHGGQVQAELANEFPGWHLGDNLDTVGDAYERLLPGVSAYVSDLVAKLYGAGHP